MKDLGKTELNIKTIAIMMAALVGYVAWFYNSVVIPINNIQSTQALILAALQDNKTFQQQTADHFKSIDDKINGLQNKK